MIYPRYCPLYRRFWSMYFRHIIRSDFSAMQLATPMPELAPDKSVLLLQNHISWWDGFWAYRFNDRYAQRRFHVMMLEEELAKRRFLTYAGAFSIQRNSRQMVASLNFAAELLRDARNLLLLFPQGEIRSMQVEELYFGKGVQRVIRKAVPHTQVLMSIVLPDYFSDRKPRLRFYLAHLPAAEVATVTDWTQLFNAFYQESRKKQAALTG